MFSSGIFINKVSFIPHFLHIIFKNNKLSPCIAENVSSPLAKVFLIPAAPQSTYTSVLAPHGHHILSLSSSSSSQGSFFICEQKFAPTILHHCQLVFSLLVMNFQRNRINEVHIYIYRRRQWHPTSVFLPGKSHGQRSLVGVVHGVTKSWTRLSNFTFTFHFHVLEREMATHSSVLAWRIPGMAEPGGLPSMGSHRVGHD